MYQSLCHYRLKWLDRFSSRSDVGHRFASENRKLPHRSNPRGERVAFVPSMRCKSPCSLPTVPIDCLCTFAAMVSVASPVFQAQGTVAHLRYYDFRRHILFRCLYNNSIFRTNNIHFDRLEMKQTKKKESKSTREQIHCAVGCTLAHSSYRLQSLYYAALCLPISREYLSN